jgi:hypothetical protein
MRKGYPHSAESRCNREDEPTGDFRNDKIQPGRPHLGGCIRPRLCAIWAAPIGFDRLLGYGLEDATGFKDTHLGRV